jgi:hypothetical protein
VNPAHIEVGFFYFLAPFFMALPALIGYFVNMVQLSCSTEALE